MKIQEIMKRSEVYEKALISGLLSFPERMKNVISEISETELNPRYAKIFKIISDAHFNDLDVSSELFKNGINISDYNMEGYPTTLQMKNLIKDIKRYSLTTKLGALLESNLHNLDPEKIDNHYPEFHNELIKLAKGLSQEDWEIKTLMKYFEKEQEIYSKKIASGDEYLGFASGFQEIDKMIDGLRTGHLWILGGYTSSGKTFASLNIVYEVLKQKKRVVYLSLEMAKNQIIARLLGIMSKVNGTSILRGTLDEEQKESVNNSKKFLCNSDLAVYNELYYVDRIKATMYEQYHRKKVDLFVLDYLQLVSASGNKTEYETMRDAVKEFQQIGLKLGVPIILLSQISNESARSPKSHVMGFKGAGDIGAAADLAIEFLSDEKDDKEKNRKIKAGEAVNVKAIVKKNRHGRTGVVLLEFNGGTGRFDKRV